MEELRTPRRAEASTTDVGALALTAASARAGPIACSAGSASARCSGPGDSAASYCNSILWAGRSKGAGTCDNVLGGRTYRRRRKRLCLVLQRSTDRFLRQESDLFFHPRPWSALRRPA